MRILVFLLWLLLGAYLWFQCGSNCCATATADDSSAAVLAPEAIAKDRPLTYNWTSSENILGSTWSSYKDSILNSMKPNKVLEITGLYSSDETNNTGKANLGIARADQARQGLGLTPEQVELKSRLVPTTSLDKDNKFVAATFNSLIKSENVKEETVTDKFGNVSKRTTIYFPFNSTNKLNDSEVENYLNDVAARVKSTGEKVQLVGHTDNVGGDGPNIALGQRRADIVKDYLIRKGVSPSKILANSKGEAKPIATNDTDQGRAKNRRTELTIIK